MLDCVGKLRQARYHKHYRPAISSNASNVVSFDRRNFRTLTLLNSHVSKTVARTRYSSSVRSVKRPSASRRYLAKRLIACSALFLFQGTPSWSRNVNIFAPLFRSEERRVGEEGRSR